MPYRRVVRPVKSDWACVTFLSLIPVWSGVVALFQAQECLERVYAASMCTGYGHFEPPVYRSC